MNGKDCGLSKNPARTKTLSGEFWKNSEVVECIGCLDEANSFIGVARVFVKDDMIKNLLLKIQIDMFKVGREVSSGENVVDCEDIICIEKTIREFENKTDLPHEFLILENSEETAFLSIARTIVRRAERRMVGLYKKGMVGEFAIQWVNRLSYLIYLVILYIGRDFIKVN